MYGPQNELNHLSLKRLSLIFAAKYAPDQNPSFDLTGNANQTVLTVVFTKENGTRQYIRRSVPIPYVDYDPDAVAKLYNMVVESVEKD